MYTKDRKETTGLRRLLQFTRSVISSTQELQQGYHPEEKTQTTIAKTVAQAPEVRSTLYHEPLRNKIKTAPTTSSAAPDKTAAQKEVVLRLMHETREQFGCARSSVQIHKTFSVLISPPSAHV
ncbi:hypothetical protein PROFUN_05575 [Planoprotostelium fungivorum]|uniref:Uncharacterized protein n=1 Tax=Planoprotostelium fungivorum TaxID=1890364 RepID=A0A2P6N073_9EUKA|nr:hypothetical protein PROFUN_05575 [Planoprotostelium fungivorum]